MSHFPIGIQDFPTIRRNNFFYVDKTKYIDQMLREGNAYFLSRPRRFGKSLLISTLESLFNGERELFSGLWIDSSNYEWKEFPVIRLDFSKTVSFSTEALSVSLQELIQDNANKYGITGIQRPFPSSSLSALVSELAKRNRVVILIDEYDKPLVNQIDDLDLMEKNRKFLNDFYSMIKALGPDLHYVFITGVSRFSKVSLFSGMNNLIDISSDTEFSSIVGLTEVEIIRDFKLPLIETARIRNENVEETIQIMRTWYNGYRFFKTGNGNFVYNPLSVMQFLRRHQLDNFWFSTATPTFAIDLIKKKKFPVMRFEEGPIAGKEIEENYDVNAIDLITLLYQTGYLTIKEYDDKSQFYRLGFPNEEVRRSFLEHLLHGLSGIESSEINNEIYSISKAIEEGDLNSFVQSFNALLSSTPYQIHIDEEVYYQSMIYLVLRALGFKVDAEVCTSRGRIDMVLETKTSIYIFEFKINKSTEIGFKQILERGYHEKFLKDKRKICLVSINFNSKKKIIDDWILTDLKEIL